MQTVLSDHEGALTSDEGALWAEKWSTNLRLTPKGNHAWLIERHHQALRDLLRKIESQALAESLGINGDIIVAEGLHVKNIMTSVGGSSPHEALLGRAPRLLMDIEEGGAALDEAGLSPGIGRRVACLREIAVTSMAEATAPARMARAEHSKSRTDGASLQLEVGDAVDIFRRPVNKDLSGWRGPCIVVSTSNLSQGYYDVRWQGRVMTAVVADVRRHIYLLNVYFNQGFSASVQMPVLLACLNA